MAKNTCFYKRESKSVLKNEYAYMHLPTNPSTFYFTFDLKEYILITNT